MDAGRGDFDEAPCFDRMSLKPGATIDNSGKESEIVTTGRHDPCVGLRATPIAEAMVALVLLDHYLRHRAQNADVVSATPVVSGRDE